MKQLFVIIFLLSLVWGCTFNEPQGPLFERYSEKSNDKALVYVYRTSGERFGYNRIYYLLDAKGKVTDLEHGGYFPFEVEPGKVSLLSDDDKSTNLLFGGNIRLGSGYKYQYENAFLEFEAIGGETYFIRFRPITHPTYFEPTLALVTENEGMKEISQCKLILKKE